jgi:MoaA/NifB/PqqE/SkfB family radical SAM enzyme
MLQIMFHTVIPHKIRLEASSRCQLRCPSCPTASKAIHPAVGSGVLKLDDFVKLIDENPWIKEIELANYGEIFLNPHILNVIKYGYERGVSLSASTGVNLNNVKEDVLEGIVKYKLRDMTVSIDGASEEIYKIYRVRGSYNTVIENIKKINHYKKVYKSEYPLLSWQFVVFGHNEHEIPAARQLAGELNMRFYVKLSWDDQFSPIRDREYVKKEAQLDAVTRNEYKQTHGIDYMQKICSQLWERPQINWDGKVLGCCRNFWGDFGGNAFKEGALRSLNNEKIVYARRMLFGKTPPRDDIPCSTCEIYLDMKARGGWLKRTPLSPSRNALWYFRQSLIWFVVTLSRMRNAMPK